MNFYNWMISKYLGKDTPRGDLAGDMKGDETFPIDEDGTSDELYRDYVLKYLKRRHACKECIALFKRCWRDYANERK